MQVILSMERNSGKMNNAIKRAEDIFRMLHPIFNEQIRKPTRRLVFVISKADLGKILLKLTAHRQGIMKSGEEDYIPHTPTSQSFPSTGRCVLRENFIKPGSCAPMNLVEELQS